MYISLPKNTWKCFVSLRHCMEDISTKALQPVKIVCQCLQESKVDGGIYCSRSINIYASIVLLWTEIAYVMSFHIILPGTRYDRFCIAFCNLSKNLLDLYSIIYVYVHLSNCIWYFTQKSLQYPLWLRNIHIDMFLLKMSLQCWTFYF